MSLESDITRRFWLWLVDRLFTGMEFLLQNVQFAPKISAMKIYLNTFIKNILISSTSSVIKNVSLQSIEIALGNKTALDAFKQYLQSCNQEKYLFFWLHVENFRVSAEKLTKGKYSTFDSLM